MTDNPEHDWRVHPREIIEQHFEAYDTPIEDIDDLIGQSADDPLTLNACEKLAEIFDTSVEFWHNTWRLHTIDLIKDLKRARVGGWISVEDRPLPDEEYGARLITDGETVEHTYGRGNGMILNRVFEYVPVTHWQPLPSPPSSREVDHLRDATKMVEEKTLRDEFAMAAMTAIVTDWAPDWPEQVEQCYRIADAMMEARKK